MEQTVDDIERAKKFLAFTGTTYTGEDPSLKDIVDKRGVFGLSETLAIWVHNEYGIPVIPGQCPCFHCRKTHESIHR